MDRYEVLHKKFDIETHKKHFVNYLEVVILENGTVEYAVPSHQEKLIRVCLQKLNISRQELMDLCPREYYGAFMEWLCQTSGAVAVWERFFTGDCNAQQNNSLKQLKLNGLYKGVLKNNKTKRRRL